VIALTAIPLRYRLASMMPGMGRQPGTLNKWQKTNVKYAYSSHFLSVEAYCHYREKYVPG
jgi:hypothetical protein